MSWLLDTNVVSELRKAKAGKADAAVTRWALSVNPAALHISAITVLELELGVLQIERRDARQGKALRQWLQTAVWPTFSQRIIAVDAAVALQCAALHVPDRRSERDALIAATAMVHRMTVVTRNTQDFEGTGVPILNPWLEN